MNFFEHQDRARRKTTRLVVLFILAVIMILLAVNAAAYGILHLTYVGIQRHDRFGRIEEVQPAEPLWQRPGAYALVSGCTLLIVVGGSLYKTASLARGGRALAEQLGGRPLQLTSPDAQDQVLRNVVEEMSIASGVPVPAVYVMEDEPGINAFAAGFSTRDAVIAVTRGALQKLNRDELQGVVAHEFSHILNGDMRLNLRLIGILHGILVIGLLGYAVLRSMQFVRVSGRRNDKGGGAIVLILLAGAALLVIGYVGVFFGRLIQAAVSRQREFLADASAVQFTRNSTGLAGALRKIGADSAGSRIENHNALEAAHMFFGSASSFSLIRLMATHPPLEERIRAIDPTFRGELDPATASVAAAPQPAAMGFAPRRTPMQPQAFVERAGAPGPAQVHYASQLVSAIPPAIGANAREPFGARTVVFALLMSDEPDVRQRQLEIVRQNVEPACHRETLEMIDPVARLGAAGRLPLLDLSLPALRQMSPRQIAQFRAIVKALIDADARVTLFEFALAKILEQNLRPPDDMRARRAVRFYAITPVLDEAATVLAALASASSNPTEAAYRAGAARLDADRPPPMPRAPDLPSLNASLEMIAQASGAVKQRVIDAAAHVVAADGQVEPAEAELLRALAATLEVPIPPIVAAAPA
jgi:Zn-dependent protease with chaperone function